MVLPVILVQCPQDRPFRADRFQFWGSSHRAVEFLQLVFIPLCVLLEDLQTVGHVVLAGGALAAQVGHEACKSRGGNHNLQQEIQILPKPPVSAQPWPFLPWPTTLHFPKGHEYKPCYCFPCCWVLPRPQKMTLEWGGTARFHKGDDSNVL